MELTNDDIGDEELGFSWGGKKILRRILGKIKKA